METLQNAPARHGQAATKHPLVSVVMPAYNAEKYIGEAIRSVQSQTNAAEADSRLERGSKHPSDLRTFYRTLSESEPQFVFSWIRRPTAFMQVCPV